MNRVVDVLDREAARHPDRACLVDGTGSLSYHEVYQRTLRIAGQLHRDGFAPGEHGAVLAPNDALGFVCALGLNRAGLVWLPVNARDSAEYIAAHLARFDADVLFLHSSFEHYVPIVTERAPSIRRIVVYDRDLDSWAGDAPATDVAAPRDPETTAAIFATSGTTGVPKGVELSTRAFGFLIDALGTILAGDERTVYLAAAPLTHVSGRICLTVMGLGGTTVVLERATPQAVLDALERHAITLTFLPPTVIYALLTHPGIEDREFPALRRLGYGSAPMRPDALARALELFGPVLAQGYGQTEAPILISSLEPEDHFVDGALAPVDRLTSAGRATPFTEIAILDDAGTARPTGEVGEICVRGDYLMSRYYQDPEATAEVSRFGWHHTGDLGYLDGDHYLHIVDRKKDVIISGGFNVYSAEVERALAQHPAVVESAVVGVPDDHWGERVCAAVVTRPDRRVTADELIRHVRERLGPVRTPKHIELVTQLPRNNIGKVVKPEVRRLIAERITEGD